MALTYQTPTHNWYVQVLATADTEELNFILLNVNCAALAEVVSQVTMEMLTGPDKRLPELQVLTRLVSPALLSYSYLF